MFFAVVMESGLQWSVFLLSKSRRGFCPQHFWRVQSIYRTKVGPEIGRNLRLHQLCSRPAGNDLETGCWKVTRLVYMHVPFHVTLWLNSQFLFILAMHLGPLVCNYVSWIKMDRIPDICFEFKLHLCLWRIFSTILLWVCRYVQHFLFNLFKVSTLKVSKEK